MVNRRSVLGIGALGVAGVGNVATKAVAGSKNNPMTFVLVHGTWHGGWVWRDVRNYLEDLGHRVFTPTLTGCGERVHLSQPGIGLDTHIKDITNVIEFEELEDFILVGHSFTGLAITGVADQYKQSIRHICYFDAIAPSEERNTGVPRNSDGSLPAWFIKRQAKFEDGYKMNFWEEYPIEMLLPANSHHAARVRRLISSHPAKTWTDTLHLENGGWQGMSRSFIHCVGQKYKMSSEKMVGPARQPGWEFLELDIPRAGMVTHPELVADTFLKLAHYSTKS